MKQRLFSFLLSIALLTGLLPLLPKASADFENTYINTGNQAADLIGVAMTQLGYTEGPNNDTKYGDWMGFPNQPWCASFISWCAAQADISPSIIARTAWAAPTANPGFDLPCFHGSEYTPKPGDLFFKEDFSHVGIVYAVEGENVLTIEANTNNDGSPEGYTVLLRKRLIAESYFGVPSYNGSDPSHTYVRKYNPGHPHASYYLCTTCGDSYYTGTNAHVLDCKVCMSCGCSTDKEGYYTVTCKNSRLVVYSKENPSIGEDWSCRKGYLDPNELVYVVAANRDWAHIIYGNSVGYVKMAYLQKFLPAPTELASDSEKYYSGDTATLRFNGVHTATDYIVTVIKDGTQLLCRNTVGTTSMAISELACGRYEVFVKASDGEVLSDSAHCSFRVLDTSTISFEPTGGTGGPSQMVKLWDTDLMLDSAAPIRDGYTFLGWNTNIYANYAAYEPGSIWTENRDATLFAIWQEEDAVPVSLHIHIPAHTNVFTIGQQPDTAGLVLGLTYSDGTVQLIRSGFALDGFDCNTPGTYPVTVTYGGLSVSYDICVLPCPVSQNSKDWSYGMADLFPMF